MCVLKFGATVSEFNNLKLYEFYLNDDILTFGLIKKCQKLLINKLIT